MLKSLKIERKDTVDNFSNSFKNSSYVATSVGEETKIPRLCGRQTTRYNIQNSDPKARYRITIIFISFTKHFKVELKSRF